MSIVPNSFGATLPGQGTPPLRIIDNPDISRNELARVGKKQEIVTEKITETLPRQITEEKELPTDTLSALERKILIGLHTYGHQALTMVAAFAGVSVLSINEALFKKSSKGKGLEIEKDKWVEKTELYKQYEKGDIPCYTRAELVSRLCVIADTAKREADKLVAIDKLMQFRGIANPDGGSRSFERTLMRFQK